MSSVYVKMIAVWLLSDAVYSIFYYIDNPSEKWIKNHSFRIIRGILAIILMII
jgi:small-conductance mechanosensitive channel